LLLDFISKTRNSLDVPHFTAHCSQIRGTLRLIIMPRPILPMRIWLFCSTCPGADKTERRCNALVSLMKGSCSTKLFGGQSWMIAEPLADFTTLAVVLKCCEFNGWMLRRWAAGAGCGGECCSPGSAIGFCDPASQQQLHRHPPGRSGHQGEHLVDCPDSETLRVTQVLIYQCLVHMARHAFQLMYADMWKRA